MTEDIKQKLREWADRYETADFIKSDPVQFPRLAAQGLNLSRLTEKEQRRVETVALAFLRRQKTDYQDGGNAL